MIFQERERGRQREYEPCYVRMGKWGRELSLDKEYRDSIKKMHNG